MATTAIYFSIQVSSIYLGIYKQQQHHSQWSILIKKGTYKCKFQGLEFVELQYRFSNSHPSQSLGSISTQLKIDHCAGGGGKRNSSNYSENVMFKRGVQSMHWRFFMRESAASKLSINQEANRISSPKCLGCLCAEQTLKKLGSTQRNAKRGAS